MYLLNYRQDFVQRYGIGGWVALLEDTLILFCSDNGASGEVVREVDVSAWIGGPERWASLKTKQQAVNWYHSMPLK